MDFTEKVYCLARGHKLDILPAGENRFYWSGFFCGAFKGRHRVENPAICSAMRSAVLMGASALPKMWDSGLVGKLVRVGNGYNLYQDHYFPQGGRQAEFLNPVRAKESLKAGSNELEIAP